MTLISSFATPLAKSYGNDEKYVKQTYETLSRNDSNLENIALQIAQMPVREQRKFFRLLLNYVDITSNHKIHPTMKDVVELCERMIEVINDYYEEQELNELEGI